MTAAYATAENAAIVQGQRAEKQGCGNVLRNVQQEDGECPTRETDNNLEKSTNGSKDEAGGPDNGIADAHESREHQDSEMCDGKAEDSTLSESVRLDVPARSENSEERHEDTSQAAAKVICSVILANTVSASNFNSHDEVPSVENDVHLQLGKTKTQIFSSAAQPATDSFQKSNKNQTGSMPVLRNDLQDTENSICAFEVNDSLEESPQAIERSLEQSIDESIEFLPRKCTIDESTISIDSSYDPKTELNFHEAVRAGDAKSVTALLASGAVQNLDEPDWNVSGDPPLLVAATNHCLPVLSVLLAHGCDPAVRSPRGETALHRVILNGGPGHVLKFVGALLKHGCPPSVKEAGGATALHVLTRQLAHAQGSRNPHYDFEAALKALELLAKAGPVNAKDHQGRSALHILAASTAFENNHRTQIESLINTLLTAGADPALKNDRGETPLHECLECGALNTAFLLIPHTPPGIVSRYGETPLHIASRKNYVETVTRLLEHGEDPSVQDVGGNTPLHLASARGFHQTVSLLVTSPLAQLERVNGDGLTALQVAAESGFVNAVRLLLKAGADPTETVNYYATTHRHPDISVLIDHEMSRRRQLAA